MLAVDFRKDTWYWEYKMSIHA